MTSPSKMDSLLQPRSWLWFISRCLPVCLVIGLGLWLRAQSLPSPQQRWDEFATQVIKFSNDFNAWQAMFPTDNSNIINYKERKAWQELKKEWLKVEKVTDNLYE